MVKRVVQRRYVWLKGEEGGPEEVCGLKGGEGSKGWSRGGEGGPGEVWGFEGRGVKGGPGVVKGSGGWSRGGMGG